MVEQDKANSGNQEENNGSDKLVALCNGSKDGMRNERNAEQGKNKGNGYPDALVLIALECFGSCKEIEGEDQHKQGKLEIEFIEQASGRVREINKEPAHDAVEH